MIGCLLVTLLLPAVAHAQQTIIFVRHAERADGGAGVNTMSKRARRSAVVRGR